MDHIKKADLHARVITTRSAIQRLQAEYESKQLELQTREAELRAIEKTLAEAE